MIRKLAGLLIFALVVGVSVHHAARADQPASQPTTQTGEQILTFTQRSPLSDPKALAQRLGLKAAELGADYDLSQSPFRAYVPQNYDAATAHGLFVYLGYKDTVATPPLWQPILDKNHLIFISAVSHTGDNYAPSIPRWQTVGLALDAVFNCEKRFNIDARRIYLMSWAKDSMKTSDSVADVFTGLIVTGDSEYFGRINLAGGMYYPPEFTPPGAALMSAARKRSFFLIDDGSAESVKKSMLVIGAMRRDGFARVMRTGLSYIEDLHFPNMKVEWFEQEALPFLDKAAAQAEVVKSEPAGSSTQPASPAPSAAQHLLSMAQLYISNGQTDKAREKLQQIIDAYPNDPAAEKAKQLLQQLGGQ